MNLEERIQQSRANRQRIWRRQLLWGLAFGVFCALWQPSLYNAWRTYEPVIGWWIIAPIWILAGFPTLTFFWFYHGRVSMRRVLEMLLLYGPVGSILMGWMFWSAFVGGNWLVTRF